MSEKPSRTVGTADAQVELVQRVCRYIEAHIRKPPTLAQMGAHFHVSPYHLQRVFKRVMGITPRQYAEVVRLERLKARLREGASVTRALYEVGYGSSSRLYEGAGERMGMTPAAYRSGGAGMCIRYSIVDSPLGRLLVGVTERGVCSVCLGEQDEALEACLYREYPAADIQRDRWELCEWAVALVEHLEGNRPHLELPLDVQATAFQWQVWQALQAIPYGETRTYREVAEAIGQPGAVGAVARAVAANPTMLVVPCHRATREDGEASHYYDTEWGVRKRRALVEHERQRVAQGRAGTERR